MEKGIARGKQSWETEMGPVSMSNWECEEQDVWRQKDVAQGSAWKFMKKGTERRHSILLNGQHAATFFGNKIAVYPLQLLGCA